MAELIQDKLYQVAIGSRWKFSFIHAKNEEDLIRFLAEHYPNRSDIYGATEFLTDGTSHPAKIISHPLFETLYAQREALDPTSTLPAGVTMIHNKPWAVLLPTGGMTPDSPCQWNDLLTVTDGDNSRAHHVGMASWCLEDPSPGAPTEHMRRGIMSAENWDLLGQNPLHETNGGFRPVLIPLDPDTLAPRPSFFLGREDGDIFRLGTLYMDGVALANPQDPTITGDIPDYVPGADLRIGDSSHDINNRITWIKVGDALICDRNILKAVSWNDLDKMGLARGPEHLQKEKPLLDHVLENARERLETPKTNAMGRTTAQYR